MADTAVLEAKRYIGADHKREEDRRLVTGMGHYVDDLKFAGLLHLAVLRSPYAHAKVNAIDVEPAKGMSGVVGVYTHEDIKDLCGSVPGVAAGDIEVEIPPRTVLADGEVCFVGQAVAAVVAESAAEAQDALMAIDVDYDPLPAVVDVEKASEAGAATAHSGMEHNISFNWKVSGGDLDAAFSEADRVIEQKVVSQRLIPCAIETRGSIGQYLAGEDELTFWTSTQIPHIVRAQIALCLGLREGSIRVITPEVGGGFGSKLNFYVEDALVAILSRIHSPHPVKWIETRRENLTGTIHGRGQVADVEVAFNNDGTVTGIRCNALSDVGAYHQLFTPVIPTLTGLMICGSYRIPAAELSLTGVLTNKMSTDAYRGAGRPEATFIIERMMDIVAAELEMDPLEVRRKNFADQFPFETATGLLYDTGDYTKSLDKLLEICDYQGLRDRQTARRDNGELVGIGISTYVEICGMGPSKGMPGGGWESARVSVGPTGEVDVYSGTCAHGQGQETTFAQIVADLFSVTPNQVAVHRGDTGRLPYGIGTFGSRGTAVGGTAVVEAGRLVIEKMKGVAALLLEVSQDTIEFDDGEFRSGEEVVSYADVCFQAHRADKFIEGMEPGLEETYFFEPSNFTYPFGAHLCLVSIDRDTGRIDFEAYYAVDDCGRVINPLLVDGQVHGGIAQGVGQALFEQAVYDEDGQLVTGTFMDYALPRAEDFPWFNCARTETPTDVNPLGVKGVGEAGTIGSTPAVINAIVDALKDYGVRHIDMPLTPEKVWRIIRSD